MCVGLPTSAYATWDFIIIFNIASVLFDENSTCCTLYELLWTSFIGFTFFEFDRYRLLILNWASIWQHSSIWIMLYYLIHLHILLSHFHFFISFKLRNSLTEILIYVLLSTLGIRTRLHSLLETWGVAWITRCIWARLNSISINSIINRNLLVLTICLAINLRSYSVILVFVFVIGCLHVYCWIKFIIYLNSLMHHSYKSH